MTKSLDDILNQAQQEWKEQGRSNEDIRAVTNFLTGRGGKPLKQDLEKSLLALLPKKSRVVKYNPDKHLTESTHAHSMSVRIGRNQAIQEMEKSIKQFCRGKETQ